MPQCVAAGQTPIDESITAGEYLEQRLREIGLIQEKIAFRLTGMRIAHMVDMEVPIEGMTKVGEPKTTRIAIPQWMIQSRN